MALPCPLGQYCEDYALPAPNGDCYEGYFCNGSSVSPNPQLCSKGYYCPQGTAAEIACAPGTFSGKLTSSGTIEYRLSTTVKVYFIGCNYKSKIKSECRY